MTPPTYRGRYRLRVVIVCDNFEGMKDSTTTTTTTTPPNTLTLCGVRAVVSRDMAGTYIEIGEEGGQGVGIGREQAIAFARFFLHHAASLTPLAELVGDADAAVALAPATAAGWTR